MLYSERFSYEKFDMQHKTGEGGECPRALNSIMEINNVSWNRRRALIPVYTLYAGKTRAGKFDQRHRCEQHTNLLEIKRNIVSNFQRVSDSKSDSLIKSHQCQAARLKSTNRIPDLGFSFYRPNLIKEFHFDFFVFFPPHIGRRWAPPPTHTHIFILQNRTNWILKNK